MFSGALFVVVMSVGLVTACRDKAEAASTLTGEVRWTPVREPSLEIIPGSALDFSTFFPGQEAIIDRPVTTRTGGGLAVGGRPQRFLCASMILPPSSGGFPDHSTSDRYAAQLRRGGYNLVRMMFLDATLMTRRTRDFDYDSVQLDNLQYLLAALRHQGIRWVADALTSGNGSYGDAPANRWDDTHHLKVKVFVDPVARRHWAEQVTHIFGAINPYTGRSALADPALLGLVFVNEGGLQFQAMTGGGMPAEVRPAFRAWLSKRYKTRPQDFGRVWSQPYSSLTAAVPSLPDSRERSARVDDVLAFYTDLQSETAHWMEAELRRQGYKGLVTAYNNLPSTHMMRSRAQFPWVDMHAYHDESFSFAPGATIKNNSSFDDRLRALTYLTTSRLAGRAFTVTEYGQPFWNSYRREVSLTIPAYAALHDWDAICQYGATSVDLSYVGNPGWKQRIMPYSVGLDPVGRATETLAALLFRRGDVDRSPTATEIVLPGGPAERDARVFAIPRDIAEVSLVNRTETTFADSPGAPPVSTAGDRVTLGAPSLTSKALSKLSAATGAAGNSITDKTGQISIDFRSRRMEVRTARTEATVFDSLRDKINLGSLSVDGAAQPTLVSLSSLDNQPLKQSKRMLMIVATDALNTDMKFESDDRRKLVELGRLPAVVRSGRIEVTIGKDPIQITPLAATGRPERDRDAIEMIEPNHAIVTVTDSFYFLVTRETR